jgi:hypothetical protein
MSEPSAGAVRATKLILARVTKLLSVGPFIVTPTFSKELAEIIDKEMAAEVGEIAGKLLSEEPEPKTQFPGPTFIRELVDTVEKLIEKKVEKSLSSIEQRMKKLEKGK